MKLNAVYGPGRFGLSFELFPPKTPAGDEELFRHLPVLMAFRPSFVTCTYGAGGSTRQKTLDVVAEVRRQYQRTVASHLTCVGATADDLRVYLHEAGERGVENIVALRGDPPRGEQAFRPVPGGLRYASELVELIRSEFPKFGIAVAGYPETHQEAVSPERDLENLKRKVDLGGDVVITQLFYDNADFFRFRERCDRLAIRAPIVPGILPVTNLPQVRRIAELCRARLPDELAAALAACDGRADDEFSAGVDYATRQVEGLLAGGVPGLHFYVLNKSSATARVLECAGVPRGDSSGPT
jgi:methylenetetrahydrofolate reductase (NADPH)